MPALRKAIAGDLHYAHPASMMTAFQNEARRMQRLSFHRRLPVRGKGTLRLQFIGRPNGRRAESGSVTLIYGEAGTGKTNLCLVLSRNISRTERRWYTSTPKG